MTDAQLSFNEVEALAAKAARGAGLGWGQAEDLGRAARWLAERGFDWSQPSLRLLDGADAPEAAASLLQEADRASSASEGDSWSTGRAPRALLVPMLSASLYGRDLALTLRFIGSALTLAPDGSARVDGQRPDLDRDGPVAIDVTRDGLAPHGVLAIQCRPSPLPAAAMARLSALADRTLVPASEASRSRGAGSSRSDND